MSVAILLAEGFEEIELISVWDILKRAKIEVTAFSLSKNLEVIGGQKIIIKADEIVDIEKIKSNFEYLFLPGGGVGTQNLKNDERVIKLVKFFKENKEGVTAICAAPTVLEKAGIVGDLVVTSYPSFNENFKNYSNNNVVQSENIITSQGVGTAIEFALKLVKNIKGEVKAKEIAKSILFEYWYILLNTI